MTDLIEVINFFQPFKDRRRLSATESIQTDVITAPLHVGCRKVFRKNALEKRNILLHKLFLQILRSSGNDHSTSACKRCSNCGYEIGESLTRARAGFNNQVAI